MVLGRLTSRQGGPGDPVSDEAQLEVLVLVESERGRATKGGSKGGELLLRRECKSS